MLLKNFQVVRPKVQQSQKEVLDWILSAHLYARKKIDGKLSPGFSEDLRERMYKIGLGEDKIQFRGFQMLDSTHQDWDRMELFNLNSAPEGYHLDKRMEFFNRHATDIFEKLYPEKENLPEHLIHVTCTGYVAPSPAQQVVSKRGKRTMVTHAYHMGCYGAFPSIRMAMGHHSCEKTDSDIIHTEFCSIHMNPTQHSTEQLVVQSLFGDGFIKYTLGVGGKGLEILAVSEEIIEDSTTKMTWDCHPWGFQMTLAVDVPLSIRRNIEGYIKRLAEKAGVGPEELKGARYAIHPGGPKIIDQIGRKLALEEEQFRHSKEVLRMYGNMSSATLPHVWDRMLKDDAVQSGEKVVSMAFGPGLSISGALFEVRK